MKIEKAQRQALRFAHQLEKIGLRLHQLTQALPLPRDLRRMLEDEVPNDVATELYAVLKLVQDDYLRPAAEYLRQAAKISGEALRGDFDEPMAATDSMKSES